MNGVPNQRRFSRVPVQLFVEIRHNDVCLSSNKTHDLSMKGLFVHTGKTLPIGAPCLVKIILEGSQGEQSVEVSGRVIRVTNAGMAVEFQESDLESYQHLRSLILFNAPNASQVQEELGRNVGFKPRG
jgi:hypothetical protein